MGVEPGTAQCRPRGSSSNSTRRARARQKDQHTITIGEMGQYRHAGVVADSMKPLVRMAQDELRGWIADLGGEEHVSAQERSVLDDAARLGVIVRAQILRFVRSDGKDRHAATSATTAVGARRASLEAVGLARRANLITIHGVVAEIEAEKGEP